ncbi:MAG: Nif11-like leader peptide family natural product precursor [Actinomycetota bacterium]|nr:Nif11-like leader peptide family natural product precursor [Actinomycetota bacterium]
MKNPEKEAAMNLEDYIKDLDPELQEKARACGSVEELLALAKEAKVPLPDEALAVIAGGDDQDAGSCRHEDCPKCGSKDTVDDGTDGRYWYWHCNTCGYKWKNEVHV